MKLSGVNTIAFRAVFMPVWFMLMGWCAFAQTETQPHVQVLLGYVPYEMRGLSHAVPAGENLDAESPRSIIVFDQKYTNAAVVPEIRFGTLLYSGIDPYRMNMELGAAYYLNNSSIHAIKFGMLIEPEFKRAVSPLAAIAGIGVDGFYQWGSYGKIQASSPEDNGLLSPNGHRFPIGSTIRVFSGLFLGYEGYFGVRFYVGAFHNLFFIFGYRGTTGGNRWQYFLVDRDDDDIKEQISDSVIQYPLNTVRIDGWFARVGFSFALE